MSNESSKIIKHSIWVLVIMAIFAPPVFVRQMGWLQKWLYSYALILGFALLVSWTISKKDEPLSPKSFAITAWLMVAGYIVEGFGFIFK